MRIKPQYYLASAQWTCKRDFGKSARFRGQLSANDSFEPKASKGVLPEDFIHAIERSGLTLDQVIQQSLNATGNKAPKGRDASFYTIPIPGFESFGLRLIGEAPQEERPLTFKPFHSKVAGNPIIGTVLGHIGDHIEVLQRIPGQEANSFYYFSDKGQENEYLFGLLQDLWVEHAGQSVEDFLNENPTGLSPTPEFIAIMKEWDLEKQQGYVAFTKVAAQFPQAAYDEIVQTIEETRHKGLTFDFSQPRNIILRPDHRFGLVDYSECKKGGEFGSTVIDFMQALFGAPRFKTCRIANVKDPALQAQVRENAHAILEKLQNACIKYHVKMVPCPNRLDLGLIATKRGMQLSEVLNTLRQASIDRYQGLETDATRFAREIVKDAFPIRLYKPAFVPLYSEYLDGPCGLFTAAHFTPDPRVTEDATESLVERIKDFFS